MRNNVKLLFTALIFSATFSICMAQTATVKTSADIDLEKELKEVARERILAFDKGDKDLWSSYVADGYIIATTSGGIETKEQQIKGFRPPLAGYSDVFKFENVQVRRDGDTAVMSYVINEYEHWDNQKYVIPLLRKTDTYILRDGRWLIIASQSTFIPAERKAIKINPKIYDAYVGQYQLMHSLVYAVTREGDKLMMQEIGQPDKRELLPETQTTFFSKGDSGQIVFVKDAKGKITHLLIRDNYDIRVKKIK